MQGQSVLCRGHSAIINPLISLITFIFRRDKPASVVIPLLSGGLLRPLWCSVEVKGFCAGKPRSAVLMKPTLWSIDLACGLIDAVFKNSLDWGMGELQGGRRSCRAHLSMFTEAGAFSQLHEKRPDRPPKVQWVTLSLRTANTNTASPGDTRSSCSAHSYAPTHLYLELLLIAWWEAPHSFLVIASCNKALCPAESQIRHLNTSLFTLHVEAALVQLSPCT